MAIQAEGTFRVSLHSDALMTSDVAGGQNEQFCIYGNDSGELGVVLKAMQHKYNPIMFSQAFVLKWGRIFSQWKFSNALIKVACCTVYIAQIKKLCYKLFSFSQCHEFRPDIDFYRYG